MRKAHYSRESLLKYILDDINDNKCRVLLFNDSTSFKINRIIKDLILVLPEEGRYKYNHFGCSCQKDVAEVVNDIEKKFNTDSSGLFFVNDSTGRIDSYLCKITSKIDSPKWYSVSVDSCLGAPDISSIVQSIEMNNDSLNFPLGREIAKEYAEIFWKADAVDFNLDNPFEVGKNRSPFYIYAELLTGYPQLRDRLLDDFKTIAQDLEYDIIAGGETRGIPLSSIFGDRLKVPAAYVRKEMKKNMRSRIECMKEYDINHAKVLFVSDTISYSDSTLDFIKGIRKTGGTVKDCIVVFDRLQGAKERLKEQNINLISLTDIDALIDVGLEEGYISIPEFSGVSLYRRDEKQWHKRRGFEYHEPVNPKKHYLIPETNNVNHRRFLDVG